MLSSGISKTLTTIYYTYYFLLCNKKAGLTLTTNYKSGMQDTTIWSK